MEPKPSLAELKKKRDAAKLKREQKKASRTAGKTPSDKNTPPSRSRRQRTSEDGSDKTTGSGGSAVSRESRGSRGSRGSQESGTSARTNRQVSRFGKPNDAATTNEFGEDLS